jgi:hypothetical protein
MADNTHLAGKVRIVVGKTKTIDRQQWLSLSAN